MGLNIELPFGHRKKAGIYSTFRLTPLGKEKAEQYNQQGPVFDILNSLDEHGPSSIKAISEDTKLSVPKVKAVLKRLVAEDLVAKYRREDES